MTISRQAAELQMDEKAAPMTVESRLRFWAEMYNSNMSCKQAGYAYSEKLIQTALEQLERIVSEHVTIPRNPVDHDDAAILNAARAAGYPNAVMTEPATAATQTAASFGDLDLGTHVIISGGDVMELDAHLETQYDEQNGDIDLPF